MGELKAPDDLEAASLTKPDQACLQLSWHRREVMNILLSESLLAGLSVTSHPLHLADISDEIRLDVFVKLDLWDPDEVARRKATEVTLAGSLRRARHALGLCDLQRQICESIGSESMKERASLVRSGWTWMRDPETPRRQAHHCVHGPRGQAERVRLPKSAGDISG